MGSRPGGGGSLCLPGGAGISAGGGQPLPAAHFHCFFPQNRLYCCQPLPRRRGRMRHA